VLLFDLLSQYRLDIDALLILLDFEVEHLMTIVNILENEGVFQHLTCAQFQERMPCHIVGQVTHHNSSFPSFVHVFASNFDEVKVPVNILLAVLVVHNFGGWDDLAVSFVIMEYSFQSIVIASQLLRLF
jgi:hypothetical protein